MKFLLDNDIPDELSYLLGELGHESEFLRRVLPVNCPDEAILDFAFKEGYMVLTCNRDDFLHLASLRPHHGIIIVIRRRTRAEERAALLRLLERAGEMGIRNNLNFA